MSTPSPPSLPKFMRAAVYEKHGPPSQVVKVRNDIPTPINLQSDQLLIRVRSASLNPADWKSGSGAQKMLLNFEWPRVYGFDFEGEVVSVGKLDNHSSNDSDLTDGSDFKIGDSVFGMIRGLPQKDRGTLAEYCIVEKKVCARTPQLQYCTSQEAASIPLCGITAVKMFRACNGLKQYQNNGTLRVLVTGGAGGVGSLAIQIAKNLYNATFVCTTASNNKFEICKKLGADKVVDYKESDNWVQKLRDELISSESGSDSNLFDIILDCTDEAPKLTPLLKTSDGKISTIQTTIVSILYGPTMEALHNWVKESELQPDQVKIPFLHSLLLNENLTLPSLEDSTNKARSLRGSILQGIVETFTGAVGVRRRSNQPAFKHVIGTGDGEIMSILAKMIEDGKLKALIDREFALDDAVDAIEYQKKGRCTGKVVIKISE